MLRQSQETVHPREAFAGVVERSIPEPRMGSGGGRLDRPFFAALRGARRGARRHTIVRTRRLTRMTGIAQVTSVVRISVDFSLMSLRLSRSRVRLRHSASPPCAYKNHCGPCSLERTDMSITCQGYACRIRSATMKLVKLNFRSWIDSSSTSSL